MQPAYIVKDELGNAGQSISLTQGDTKTAQFFLFNPDGSPLFFQDTATEIVVKIYNGVSNPPILKKLSLTQVIPIADSNLGCFGFSFQLSATDTGSLPVNNSGLPVRATFTQGDGTTKEFDFLTIFNVSVVTVT